MSGEIGPHGREDSLINLGCSIVIEIDAFHYSPVAPLDFRYFISSVFRPFASEKSAPVTIAPRKTGADQICFLEACVDQQCVG